MLVEPHSHLVVDRFRVAGRPVKGSLHYLYTEALLGAGERTDDWRERSGPDFCYGVCAIRVGQRHASNGTSSETRFTLWSPRGPEFGKIEIRVDGQPELLWICGAKSPSHLDLYGLVVHSWMKPMLSFYRALQAFFRSILWKCR